jgi:hypothetical protein
MRIQLASDLHLEFYSDLKGEEGKFFEALLDVETGADVLVLAGDIGYPEAALTRKFIAWCCAHWPRVIWVYGNHEYYSKHRQPLTMAQKEGEGFKMECDHPNLVVLCDDTLELDDTDLTIVGGTLWTDLTDAEATLLRSQMNDFQMIWAEVGQRFSVEDWRALNAATLAYIQQALEQAVGVGRRVIVVSHHLPSQRMVHEKYRGHPVNCGFAGRADVLVDHPVVAAWLCGHSHGQLSVGRCHLNARGYPKEDSVRTYNRGFVLDL